MLTFRFDPRVENVYLPMRDGVMMARKNPVWSKKGIIFAKYGRSLKINAFFKWEHTKFLFLVFHFFIGSEFHKHFRSDFSGTCEIGRADLIFGSIHRQDEKSSLMSLHNTGIQSYFQNQAQDRVPIYTCRWSSRELRESGSSFMIWVFGNPESGINLWCRVSTSNAAFGFWAIQNRELLRVFSGGQSKWTNDKTRVLQPKELLSFMLQEKHNKDIWQLDVRIWSLIKWVWVC